MQPQFNRYYTYIRPLARNKVFRSYATTIFNLIAIAIFAFYAIRPTVTTIVSLEKGINEQNTVLEAVTKKRDDLAKGRANFENLDQDTRDKLNTLIPNEPDLPLLSAILSSLIEQNQATVSGIQFQSVDLIPPSNTLNKNPEISSTDFSFSIQGQFDQINAILTEIKKMPRLINIKSLSINKLSSGSILVVVNANTFYLKN